MKNGEIVAVKSIFEVTDIAGNANLGVYVPLKVSGVVGVKDLANNPNILLTNSFYLAEDKSTQTGQCPNIDALDYKPTTYDEEGIKVDPHSPPGSWGDTLYIVPMTIRPTISTEEKTYAPDETVRWTVEGKVQSGSENNHKVQFAVTIPKETQYIDDSAKDYQGKPIAPHQK